MRFILFLLSLSFSINGICQQVAQLSEVSENQTKMSEFYQFNASLLNGEAFSFEQLHGKIVIVINVASECGYTPQYAEWQEFYKANADAGVVVIGVPCNQFGEQEPGDAKTILSFCQKNYGVSFPILEKQDVKGESKSDLYAWLTNPNQNGWNKQEPNWNFCKYVINREGKLTHFFESKVTPSSEVWTEAMSKI
jgi:glutathione peroxidase